MKCPKQGHRKVSKVTPCSLVFSCFWLETCVFLLGDREWHFGLLELESRDGMWGARLNPLLFMRQLFIDRQWHQSVDHCPRPNLATNTGSSTVAVCQGKHQCQRWHQHSEPKPHVCTHTLRHEHNTTRITAGISCLHYEKSSDFSLLAIFLFRMQQNI